MPLLWVSLSADAQTASLKLSCVDPRHGDREASLIRAQAPGIVVRTAPHVLNVKTLVKTHSFHDKPPHDEPLSGTHYYFCARQEGFILLMLEDEAVFRGALIHEATGDVTPGGETVSFSKDRRAYFATEQHDGMDGQHWRIYAVNGRASWQGYDYIPRDGNWQYRDAYLSEPTWRDSGEFSAQAICALDERKTWAVTLKKIGGEWDWHPKKKCPREKP